MSTTTSAMRRRRGTPTVQLHVTVEPHIKERIDNIARDAGVPVWAVIEAAVESARLDGAGVPTNWNLNRVPQETLLDNAT